MTSNRTNPRLASWRERLIELLPDLLHHLLAGLPVLLFVWVGSIWFAETTLGKEIRGVSYRMLQRRLQPAEGGLKIQIVDIGEMFPMNGVTNRGEIKDLIDAIEAQNPNSVGVDIDFAPDQEHGQDHLVPGDLALFDTALKAKHPVYLGVYRSIAADPQAALGLPQFKGLAANLLVEKEAKHYVVRIIGDQQRGKPESNDIPALSTQLSNAWLKAKGPKASSRTGPSWVPSCFCSIEKLDSTRLAKSLIDFSIMNDLRANAISVRWGESSWSKDVDDNHSKLEGAVVLVGDIENAVDVFVDPVTNETIPGVLLHAAAVYTKVTSPLCDVEESLDQRIDISLAVVALILEWAMLLAVLGKDPHNKFSRTREQRAAFVVSIGITVAILGFGLWVNAFRIFWEGFILVALSIAIHPFAKKFLGRSYHHLLRYLKG